MFSRGAWRDSNKSATRTLLETNVNELSECRYSAANAALLGFATLPFGSTVFNYIDMIFLVDKFFGMIDPDVVEL